MQSAFMNLILPVITTSKQTRRLTSISSCNMFHLRLPIVVLLFYVFFFCSFYCTVESVTFIAYVCHLSSGATEVDLHHIDHLSLSNHLVSFKCSNGSNLLHVSNINDVQSSSFTVYSPNTQAQFIKTLKSITKDMACKL